MCPSPSSSLGRLFLEAQQRGRVLAGRPACPRISRSPAPVGFSGRHQYGLRAAHRRAGLVCRAARAGRQPRHHPSGDRDAQGPAGKARLDDQAAVRAAFGRRARGRAPRRSRNSGAGPTASAVRDLAARAAGRRAGAGCAGDRAAPQPRRRRSSVSTSSTGQRSSCCSMHTGRAAEAARAGIRTGHPRPAVEAVDRATNCSTCRATRGRTRRTGSARSSRSS